jgi:hypothetical protein
MNNEITPNYSAVENRKTLQRRRKFKNMVVCAVRIVLTAIL